MEEIGDLIEIAGEVKFEWKITDFFSLSEEKNKGYLSPSIYFSGASWKIMIYPNGETEDTSDGWIALYLMRMTHGPPVNMICSFGLKLIDGNTVSNIKLTFTSGEKLMNKGWPRFIKRSKLVDNKPDLTPYNDLTIVCTLNNSEPNAVDRSLFRRLLKLSQNLFKVFEEGTRADFKFKFDDGTINAHRMILEARPEVFEAMLKQDTKENQTGEVPIVDIDKGAMKTILEHVYCGEMSPLTTENVLSVYIAADKYDIKDVKHICLDFILQKLSVEWVHDVIEFSDLYEEREINRHAREFFKENAEEILESKEWKRFAKKNHDLSVELLGCLVKDLLPNKKKTPVA